MRNVTISIDEEAWKIYKKLPGQERSSIIRTLLKTLDPKSLEKKVEEPGDHLKKLLTLAPSQEKQHKKGDSSGPRNLSCDLENIMTRQNSTLSGYMTQMNANKHFSSYNYENIPQYG